MDIDPARVMNPAKVLQLRDRGLGLRAIGKQLGVGKHVIARVLAEAGLRDAERAAGCWAADRVSGKSPRWECLEVSISGRGTRGVGASESFPDGRGVRPLPLACTTTDQRSAYL